jgi:polyisoprenoid-binding protein YceI
MKLLTALALCASASVALGFAVPAAAALAPAKSAAKTYSIDAGHSSLLFRAKHLNVSYIYGRFNDFSGKFTFDAEKPENSKVDVEIKIESIDSGIDKRDAHLRSPDFFDAKQFATATFKSKSVKKTKEGHFDVTGDFTLHGVTKSVTLPMEHVGSAKDEQTGERAGFHGSFVLKRSDYGVSYGPTALGEEILVIVSVEGVAE